MDCTIAPNFSVDCLNIASVSWVLCWYRSFIASRVCCRSFSAAVRTASNWRLIAADPAPAVSATTRAISRARSSAAASDSSSRPVKRDSRWSRSVVRRSMVVTSDSKLRLAVGDRGRGGAVGLFDHAGGLDQFLAVLLELARQCAEILQRLRGLAVEDGELVFQGLRGDPVAGGDVVHGGHEVGHAGHQRALQRVEVVVGAGQHFLQQDVARSRSNSATVSVRRILLVSCISVTAAIET